MLQSINKQAMKRLNIQFLAMLSVILFISSLLNIANAQCPTSILNTNLGRKIELVGHSFAGISNINIAGSASAFNKTLVGNSTTTPNEAKNHFDPCFLPGNSCALAITHDSGNDVCEYDETGSLKTPSTLPIELIHFDINLAGKIINATWATATEINNNFFTLERSEDAINWSAINIIQGAGNSNSILEYSTSDENPLNGENYYRLKQTDYNGQFTYSKIKSINIVNKLSSKSTIKVFPNPSSGININYELSTESKSDTYSIVIYNMIGNVIYQSGAIEAGSSLKNSGQLNLESKLQTGTYIIKFYTSSSIAIQKLVVN